MDHGAADPTLTTRGLCLVVLAKPAITAEPGEGSFNDPSLGERDEALLPLELGHDLEPEAEFVRGPVLELALVACIGPDGLEPRVAVPVELGEDPFRSITILYVCRMNRKSVDQPEGIDCNVTLPATYLLGGIVASGPPFSVVFTDWLSRTAALGDSSWPSEVLSNVVDRG